MRCLFFWGYGEGFFFFSIAGLLGGADRRLGYLFVIWTYATGSQGRGRGHGAGGRAGRGPVRRLGYWLYVDLSMCVCVPTYSVY